MNKLKGKIKNAVAWVLRQIPLRKVTVNVQIAPRNELLKGRSALITGGSSGIGFAIAKAFCNAGCNIVITGRNAERLEKACKTIKENNGNASVKYIVMDVTHIESLTNAFESAEKQLGNSFDILVNNAGTMGKGVETASEFEQIIRTNVEGAYFLSRIFSEQIAKERKYGNILNILSSSSFRPATNPYAISKWGMRGLTIGLA